MPSTNGNEPLTINTDRPSLAQRYLRKLERVLFIAGVALLVFYGTARLDSFLSARAAAREASLPTASLALPGRDERAESLADQPRKRSQAGTMAVLLDRSKPLATVRIPAIGLTAPLFDGTDAVTLNRGLGRVPGTARPGEAGNIGIAGHRDGTLRALKGIRLGDRIELIQGRRRDLYIVDRIRIVDPSQVEVLRPQPSPSLTLVTCYPFHFLGAAPQRFVVSASLRTP